MGLGIKQEDAVGRLVRFGGLVPVGDHTETTAVAAAEVLVKPKKATGILIQAVDADIVYTLDGTDPTVTPGFLLKQIALDPLWIVLTRDMTLTIARAGTVDASVRYQFGREQN
jgi:hypothetical protein